MYVVIGATGHTGNVVAEKLLANREKVRVVGRDEKRLERFKQRAQAVRQRGMPPVEGPERRRILEQAQQDYMDFAMLGDAEAELEDGILVLRVDLRPEPES